MSLADVDENVQSVSVKSKESDSDVVEGIKNKFKTEKGTAHFEL